MEKNSNKRIFSREIITQNRKLAKRKFGKSVKMEEYQKKIVKSFFDSLWSYL